MCVIRIKRIEQLVLTGLRMTVFLLILSTSELWFEDSDITPDAALTLFIIFTLLIKIDHMFCVPLLIPKNCIWWWHGLEIEFFRFIIKTKFWSAKTNVFLHLNNSFKHLHISLNIYWFWTFYYAIMQGVVEGLGSKFYFWTNFTSYFTLLCSVFSSFFTQKTLPLMILNKLH